MASQVFFLNRTFLFSCAGLEIRHPAAVNVDSIVLGQAAGVEHVSFYSPTELLIFLYNEP